MRKIYQSAPDVPQAIANKAVDIIERHFVANGVRRAEDLPEESKVHLMRELQRFFQSDLPPQIRNKEGSVVYGWTSSSEGGFLNSVVRWFERVFRTGDDES
jgi:hypothetical protein